MRRLSPWLVMLVIATSFPLAISETATAEALLAHRITRSVYVGNSSSDQALQLGCSSSDTTGRVTFFFGAPTDIGGAFGATLWGAPNLDTTQIGDLVRDVIRGYAQCRTSPEHRLLIGIGTSNSAVDDRSTAWLQAHGKAWSEMVRQVSDWAGTYHPDAVQVFGAWDVEPSWSRYEQAEAWMQGYDDQNPGRRGLYANFSADGCPTTTATNGPCNNGWNQERIWHLAWQRDPSVPIPQIYATSGVNAKQWQLIDKWATNGRNDGIFFYGVMSQYEACRQTGIGCQGTDNTPQQAYDHMNTQLNADPQTAQAPVESVTDMRWHS